MALDSYDQIRQDIFDLSLEDLVQEYVNTESIFVSTDEMDDTQWTMLSNRLELIEERLWSQEKHDKWIPLYLALAPRDLITSKLTRYTNYIHRLGHLKDKESQMRRTVARCRLFLSYVTGHHSYLQQ